MLEHNYNYSDNNYTMPKEVKAELIRLAPRDADEIWAWMDAGANEREIARRNQWKAERIAADLLRCWRYEQEAKATLTELAKPGFWSAVDSGGAVVEIEAETGKEAAQEYVEDGDWGDINETIWIEISVWQTTVGGGRVNEEYHTITLEPDEPTCESPLHDWQQDSVRGNGGGVIVVERCQHCGVERTTNTWAQHPATGQQGLRSIKYNQPNEDGYDDYDN